jgi:hypothetical protein
MVRNKSLKVVIATGAVALIPALLAANAQAANVNRRIVAEVDPVAPSSALYEERSTGIATSKFGVAVDFNVGERFSMGPEVWNGTFLARGDDDGESSIRREDLFPGERHKLDAMRLRWNVSFWEVPASMRGFYARASYDYIRVNSRANRYTESLDSANALPVDVSAESPLDETDLITDMRHGLSLGIGNRWLVNSQSLSVTVGAGVSHYFRRSVNVDSKDTKAVADYESMINTLPDTRLALRPIPELSMGLGYAF